MTMIVIGEILIDRFPDGARPGGASFNVACHLKRFGAPVQLVTRVGDDDDGRRLKQRFRHCGFDDTDIQTDPKHPTGIVEVVLDGAGVPTFSIVENVAYDYISLDHLHRKAHWDRLRFLYFGSLVQRTAAGYKRLGALLRRLPAGAMVFCDINLRRPHYTRRSILQCLIGADVLKLSEDEVEEIRRVLGRPTSAAAFDDYLMHQFGISVMAVTRGAAGSTIIQTGGRIEVPPSPVGSIVDTVGAGDGYAAVLSLGLMRGLPLADVAAAASGFAADICRLPGAVPEDPRFYDTWKPKLETANE